MAASPKTFASAPQAPPDADHWLESLPAAVLGVDAGERVRFVNAIAADMLAIASHGLQGRMLSEVFGPDAPLVALARRAMTSQGPVGETEVAIAGPGFVLGRAAVSAAPVGDRGYVAIVIHPVARMRAGIAATTAAAARTLAHEVRNPLAGIRGAAQLIAKSGGEEHAALAALIVEEADRIHRLTERIDPREGLGPAHFAPMNVHEALGRVRQVIEATFPAVKVVERYDPSLPEIGGDLDQLIQALLNIAKNGAESLHKQNDGKLTFATRFRPGLKIRAAAGADARPQLEISIIDNGPGLDPSIADRVFEPFATTKKNGMGLGLTVAADIVALHDGRIEVDSAPGATAFRVLLPIGAKTQGAE